MHLRALGPEELMDSHSLGPEEPVDFHALHPEDLHQARLFANRNEMLRAFGEMDTVVEIGVAYGHFSRFILDTVHMEFLNIPPAGEVLIGMDGKRYLITSPGGEFDKWRVLLKDRQELTS